MQDADSDDMMIAQGIRDALAPLNHELEIACKAGLFVEIEMMRGQIFGSAAPWIICVAKIERKETL